MQGYMVMFYRRTRMAAGRMAQKGDYFFKKSLVTHRLHQNEKSSHTRPVMDDRKVLNAL